MVDLVERTDKVCERVMEILEDRILDEEMQHDLRGLLQSVQVLQELLKRRSFPAPGQGDYGGRNRRFIGMTGNRCTWKRVQLCGMLVFTTFTLSWFCSACCMLGNHIEQPFDFMQSSGARCRNACIATYAANCCGTVWRSGLGCCSPDWQEA